jgi:hypothetical protein
MTVVLFQIDFDVYGVVAFDLEHRGEVWKNRFESRSAVVDSFGSLGLLTTEEFLDLENWSASTCTSLLE